MKTNKNNKGIVPILIILVLLVIVGAGFYAENKARNKKILDSFLYTHLNDQIPDSFRIDWRKVESDFVSQTESRMFICKLNGEKAKVIEFFTIKFPDCPVGKDGCAGSLKREAIICGDKYLIHDSSNLGFPYWGPFDLKQ